MKTQTPGLDGSPSRSADQVSVMKSFVWLRQHCSITAFLRVEFRGIRFTPLKQPGTFACACPLHHEKKGEAFLFNENSGRCACIGKCQFTGADLCQLAAMHWRCSNEEARQRISTDPGRYAKQRGLETRGRHIKKHLGLKGQTDDMALA
jgi:hypothetical protein